MALADIAAAETAFAANLLYAVHGSATEAAAFIEACTYLIAFRPQEAQTGRAGTRVKFDLAQLQKLLDKAERWYAANGGTSNAGAVTFGGFADYRG